MAPKAIVVGSGPGGATAAMVLAEAGYDVVVMEKGDNWYDDLTSESPTSKYSNDNLKEVRSFAAPDPDFEPRTYRWTAADAKPRAVGAVQVLQQTVGGGAVHWGADTPRFWDIDFRKLSMLGPVPEASVSDWPFTYSELAPYYSKVEELIGVAGNVDELPELVLRHAPRAGGLPMPAGPPQYSSATVAAGCRAMGLHPFPVPMAINSQPYAGRPACNNCGFCNAYGCPINARIGALAPLRRAVLAGAEVRANAWVVKVLHSGRTATGVQWLDASGQTHTESADVVVLAAMAIETVRLALLSELPDPHSVVGRCFMMHWFTDGSGIWTDRQLGAERGRSITHDCDDFADPDYPGARDAARAAGLPYFRGGGLELGGSQDLMSEAMTYAGILKTIAPHKPFGHEFKDLMRSSVLRNRLAGVSMMGEDLPYERNRVDLDPNVRDYRNLPVARITYSPGAYELTAQHFYIPLIAEILRKAGAQYATALSAATAPSIPIAGGDVPTTQHVMGGMRMGGDESASATDGTGRFHQLDNLYVADGSVFPSSGAHNPTLTIMATAWRNATAWTSH
ncbi:MAG TPA: GMC family oxidoreductase [Acidimicrobiales bacterium]|nr:GMC family oxidoreductase [Acidimicrobiales bacterium]